MLHIGRTSWQTNVVHGQYYCIFTCSGAANVGQVANQAAVDLQQEGIAKMLCLAGIGSHNPGMIASGKGGQTGCGH